jgi:hypothetical protein
MAEPARRAAAVFAVAPEAEAVVGPLETDHIEPLRIGSDGVARDATKVAGRLLPVTGGAVLDLPVELVDNRGRRHWLVVAVNAPRRVAEGFVVASGALALDLDMRRVVEVNGGMEVGQLADGHPVRDRVSFVLN